jgi:hypothetical protein
MMPLQKDNFKKACPISYILITPNRKKHESIKKMKA